MVDFDPTMAPAMAALGVSEVSSTRFFVYKQNQARNGRLFPHSGLGCSKKVPSVTPDVFSRSFLCWWSFFLRFESFKKNGFLF